MKNQNDEFIKIAIEEARKSSWPFGALIVKDNEIISQAGSGDGLDDENDPTAHAEINAIRRASKKLNTEDLTDCVLYTSCEPCVLCFGASWYAGIRKIVYGMSFDDMKVVDPTRGEDLTFPKNSISETGIVMDGGVLKNEVMEMYKNHSK